MSSIKDGSSGSSPKIGCDEKQGLDLSYRPRGDTQVSIGPTHNTLDEDGRGGIFHNPVTLTYKAEERNFPTAHGKQLNISHGSA